jgi:hypothetical protein
MSDDLTPLRIMGEELNRLYAALRQPVIINWSATGTVESEIREGVKRVKREISEQDRSVDRAIAAIHRARSRHPCELASMPWIKD